MRDLGWDRPETRAVEVDAKTRAAIDRGIKAAAEGRSIPLEQVREMIPQWISKFESQKKP
jgi:predicted transcriptional regulator